MTRREVAARIDGGPAAIGAEIRDGMAARACGLAVGGDAFIPEEGAAQRDFRGSEAGSRRRLEADGGWRRPKTWFACARNAASSPACTVKDTASSAVPIELFMPRSHWPKGRIIVH
jgi:hypothetical protein